MIFPSQVRISKGLFGEEQLTEWFQTNGIGFIPVNQSPHTFANVFVASVKRPDFLVLLPSIGIIAVDAKNHQIKMGGFTIGEDELQKAIRFEMITRMPFWFAFLSKQENGITWYWINALKAYNVGIKRQNRATGNHFFALGLDNLTHITGEQDFGRIFFQKEDVCVADRTGCLMCG